MKIFIVYAHPSENSLTCHAKNNFIKGLESSGHSYVLSDLYKMKFDGDISEAEYLREFNYRHDLPVPTDVLAEQEKINSSDAIAFIYPVFWTEAPAKLVGWFSRVWSCGFAYGENRTMKQLEKGVVICSAGHSLQHLKEHGNYDAMKTVMLGDRLYDRVKTKDFIVLDSTVKESRDANWERHLKTAYEVGRGM